MTLEDSKDDMDEDSLGFMQEQGQSSSASTFDPQRNTNNLFEKAQMLRSKSESKWRVLFFGCVSWLTCYHCLSQASALEEELMNEYNLTDSEFSFLTTIVFIVAIFSGLLTPIITALTNLYISLTVSQCMLVISQIIWLVGCLYTLNTLSKDSILLIFYVSRIFLGVSLGIAFVSLLSLIDVWFYQSKHKITGIVIAVIGLNMGSISARYILIPIYNLNNKLYEAYILSLSISIVGVIYTLMLEKEESNYREPIITQHRQLTDGLQNRIIKLRVNYNFVSKIKLDSWMIILYIALEWGCNDTVYTQITEAFINKYYMSEWEADLILSSINIGAIVLSPIICYILFSTINEDEIKDYTNWMTLASFIQAVAWIIFVFSNESDQALKDATPWLIVIFHVCGMVAGIASAFCALFQNIKTIDLASLVTSITVVSFLFVGVLLTISYGEIADTTGEYEASVFLLAIIYLVAFIVAMLIRIL